MHYLQKLPSIAAALLIGSVGALVVTEVAAGGGDTALDDVVTVNDPGFRVVPLDGSREPGVYFEDDGSVTMTEQVPCYQPDGTIKLIAVEELFPEASGPQPDPGSLTEEDVDAHNRAALNAEPACAPPGVQPESRAVSE